MSQKRILVTGCAGFIGWKVTDMLLREGVEVIGIDNLNNAYDVQMKEWRLRNLKGREGFTFVRGDISVKKHVRELFTTYTPFEAVINLAARAGIRQSVQDPWGFYRSNVTGTIHLLEACREYGIRKFVLASTSSLYGKNNKIPYSEDDNTDYVLSPYASSKKAAETLCYTYHYLHQMDITVFRYFTVYGPAGRPDMSIFRFIQWIAEGKPVYVFGDGSQSRDFTFVEDIARGTIAGLVPIGYDIFNLGSDEPVVLMDVIRTIEHYLEKKARITYLPAHPADAKATWANIDKVKERLGWMPQTFIRDGLKKCVEWYLQEREWARHVSTDLRDEGIKVDQLSGK